MVAIAKLCGRRFERTDDEGGEYSPTDCYDTCAHAIACRMQHKRITGRVYVGTSIGDVANALGCGEDCAEYEDTHAVPRSMSGVMR